MKRREFLNTSLTITAAGAVSSAALAAVAAERSSRNREYYELRVYRLKADADHDLLDKYLQNAVIPALNRLGVRAVGAFTEKEPSKESPAVFVLISYASVDAFANAAVRLAADPDYQKSGAEYLQSPKSKPAFERIDSWLLLAFTGMPRLELPTYSREKKPRLFELRTYQSFSEAKALKKIEMFNSGEIDLMRQVGLAPIFYGQALIGRDLPHLTYMTSAPSEEAHKQHWDAFGKHPTWDKLKNDPQYADTVSKISKWILIPTPYSQI